MDSLTPSFADLVGDEDEFISEFFNRRPFLRRQAIESDPKRILSIADMDEIVHHEALRSSYMRVTKNGERARPSSYTKRASMRFMPFDDCLVPEQVYEHFRAGATITRNGMNHFRPNLRKLARDVTDRFSARTDILVFLTPAGQRGFEIHHDPADTYVVQLEGSKHWRVWPTPAERRVGDIGRHALEDLGEPLLDTSLRPGDVLYMPYGTPHAAVADDTVSLHITVTVETRMWSQLLLSIAERAVAEDPEFWDVPYLNAPTPDQEVRLKEVTDALITKLRSVDPADALHRLAASGREVEGVSQGRFFQDTAALDQIDEDTTIQASGVELTFREEKDGKVDVVIDGNTVRMPAFVAAALENIDRTGKIPAGAFLSGEHAEHSLEAVKYLSRMGALAVADR